MRWSQRVGAICYALWGALHIWAGLLMLVADARQQLDYISTQPLPPDPLPPALSPLIHALASFHAYNITWFGVLALVVAVTLNWRNSVTGYWVNLVIVGADDLGLVIFLIVPGHLSSAEAGLGPILFVLAVLFSTLALFSRRTNGPPATVVRDAA